YCRQVYICITLVLLMIDNHVSQMSMTPQTSLTSPRPCRAVYDVRAIIGDDPGRIYVRAAYDMTSHHPASTPRFPPPLIETTNLEHWYKSACAISMPSE
ncbi:hypothetical protein JI435_307800, partial [Parastagonospora nodorum SN15]